MEVVCFCIIVSETCNSISWMKMMVLFSTHRKQNVSFRAVGFRIVLYFFQSITVHIRSVGSRLFWLWSEACVEMHNSLKHLHSLTFTTHVAPVS